MARECRPIEGYPDIPFAESEPHYIRLEGFRDPSDLEGAIHVLPVTLTVGGKEYETAVQVRLDGPERQMLAVNVWDSSTKRKREANALAIQERRARKVTFARDMRTR